jgi:hypothetical protein
MMQTRSNTPERWCDDSPTKHMSRLLLFVAAVGALVSVALCVTYGLDQASVPKDEVINPFTYAMLAAFSFVLHIGAVRAWVLGWRKTGVLACIVGLLLFVVAVLLSTSGLASRVEAAKEALDRGADIKAQIDTLLAEKAAMKVTRISQRLVDNTRRQMDEATRARKAECPDGDSKQRGPSCGEKEIDEMLAAVRLAKAEEWRAATERADEIDKQLTTLRELESGVGAAKALGAWIDALTAWQKMLVLFAYELGLIVVLILAEVMGHAQPAGRPQTSGAIDRN